jgi:hypothetical protein
MFQDFLEDVGSLISMQLGGMTLDGLSTLFDQYVNLLIKAVPNLDEDEEPGTENSARRKVERQIETTSKTYDVVNVFCICMFLKWLLGNDWNLYMYEQRLSIGNGMYPKAFCELNSTSDDFSCNNLDLALSQNKKSLTH